MQNTYESFIDYCDKYDKVQEGFIFSKKDYHKNVEKFDSGESNLLLITGLSRSGKTTLGNKLIKKYNANLISLDCIENYDCYKEENLSSHEKALIKIFLNSSVGKEYSKLLNSTTEVTDDQYSKVMSQAIKDIVIPYCKSHSNEKFIIEGLQIYSDVDPSIIKDYPLIIKQTSMLKSFRRKSKRTMANFKWYINEERKLQSFKKSVK